MYTRQYIYAGYKPDKTPTVNTWAVRIKANDGWLEDAGWVALAEGANLPELSRNKCRLAHLQSVDSAGVVSSITIPVATQAAMATLLAGGTTYAGKDYHVTSTRAERIRYPAEAAAGA